MVSTNNLDQKSKVFYENFAYQNDLDYIQATVQRNISISDVYDKRVLDFGCGVGDVALYLAENYNPSLVLGIDISKKAIECAERRKREKNLENVHFLCQDLFQMQESEYDFIWSDTVIVFISLYPEVLLKRFNQLLKDGGILYVSFAEKTWLNQFIYGFTSYLNRLIAEKYRFLFYYFLIILYWIVNLFKKDLKIDKESLRNKSKHFFTPYTFLFKEKWIQEKLLEAGFKIIYSRYRIKSSVLTPSHVEIKAMKKRSVKIEGYVSF